LRQTCLGESMKSGIGALRALCVATFAALLVSCGGEELAPFNPERLIVFGDQASVIVQGSTDTNGRKYTINYADATTQVVDCRQYPIWVQVLASNYAISFDECPLPDTDSDAGLIRAKAGALAGGGGEIDVTAQITHQLERPVADGGGIQSTDLVAVFAGVNDIVAAFERFKAGASYEAAVAEVEAAGETLGAQVNRIAAAGGKVILTDVPDVSLTPYGQAQSPDDQTRLHDLTVDFVQRLQVSFTNNGRLIGYVQLNPYLNAAVNNPSGYGLVNVTEAACVPLDPLVCTSNTLKPKNGDVPAATASTWLWATSLQFSPVAHDQLGDLATGRAQSQPF
jgi:outer membrane lipase/esterase